MGLLILWLLINIASAAWMVLAIRNAREFLCGRGREWLTLDEALDNEFWAIEAFSAVIAIDVVAIIVAFIA